MKPHGVLSCFLWLMAISGHADELRGQDVARSWDKALVFVPSAFFTKTVDDVQVQRPLPVVVFLHGCGGIGAHERRWADFLKSEGFIVVMPDSMAIEGRVINCDATRHIANLGKAPVRDLRPAEAEYAHAKLQEQVWADPSNIFLMGHSEGGMGASLTQELGFRGVIISGFSCLIKGGIRAKRDTPVLAINWQSDPWFDQEGRTYRQCSERPFWRLRSNANELVLPGRGHATGYETSARQAVRQFLVDHRQERTP